MADFANVTKESNELRFDFIMTELDLALTFCDIAESSKDQIKVDRNIGHAKTAYLTARKFLNGAPLTPGMKATIRVMLDKLAPIIERIDKGIGPEGRTN